MFLKNFLSVTLITFLISFLMTSSFAQNGGAKGQNENHDNVEEMTWLIGHWKANALGGVCEEIWSPPTAGRMIGTFQLIVDGKVKFYEFMILVIENGGPTMKLKHFNADLTGWEAKEKVVTFPFMKLAKNELQMDGMTYSSSSRDSLKVELNISEKGEEKHLSFHFWRVESGN